MTQFGVASTVRKTFSRETSIRQKIDASPSQIWNILTDIESIPNWNSTIVSIKGEMKKGQKIKLVSTLDPSRTFTLKIKEFHPSKAMIWGDMMGQRRFSLTGSNNATIFEMTEKIGGPLFPLFANKIPSFDESFEQFTNDLKVKVEQG